jgi:transcriptional regulator with XRE-family HTH domain
MGRTEQTVTSVSMYTLLTLSVPFTMALSAVGTGGQHTGEYYRQRELKLSVYRPLQEQSQQQLVTTAAEDLARARSVLGISMREMASSIGVSRQALYNWKAGADMKPVNAARLENLMLAAATIAGADLEPTPFLMSRRLGGGKTLLAAIAEGEDGTVVAAELVSLVKSDASKRAALSARLAGRRPTESVDDPPRVFDE